MIVSERHNGASLSDHYLLFDIDKNILDIECHSIALDDQEKRLLFVGAHQIAFANLEIITSQIDNIVGDDSNVVIPALSNCSCVTLFDGCNVNRPVVEWNHVDPNQFAVAIDRLVRIYSIDHTYINETNIVIDSQHQRPISTICYSPHDPFLLLTGSLDGQIQVWDIRQSSLKTPPAVKLTISTPFSIRRILWSSKKNDNSNQLAVQCDRCIRTYDIRRIDSPILPSNDLEYTQRITSIDWTKQNRSIATLFADQSIKMLSKTGETLAESLTFDRFPFTFNKIRTTTYDNLFVCAARDTMSSTYGFMGWRWDSDQYLRPLADRIISTTPSPIVDFSFITNHHLVNLFNNCVSPRFNDESLNHFLILTWCRDGQLCLVDMDPLFRQAWTNQQTQAKIMNLSDSSGATNLPRTSTNVSRQQPIHRTTSAKMTMDVIQDETSDEDDENDDDDDDVDVDVDVDVNDNNDDDDDDAFHPISSPSHTTIESSDSSDESDQYMTVDRTNNAVTEVSIENEFNSLHDNYGPYITVETKDQRRRVCIIRCTHSFDNTQSFRLYLILSRHYPIISQLFVRFKFSTMYNDQHLKSFHHDIQTKLEETSYKCFYRGQLCLHKCLTKLKYLFEVHYKQEKSLLTMSIITNNSNKLGEYSSTSSEIDIFHSVPVHGNNNTKISTNNNENNSHRMFGTSSSSTRTSDSQISTASFSQANRRTCGARFSGGTHLICFGRIANNQVSSASPIPTTLNDGTNNRPQPLQIRSASLTVTKSRENSNTDEQINYRTPTTNTVQIPHIPSSQRLPMFSAPVRSSFSAGMFNEHQRSSTSYRRPINHLNRPHSTVSIYDISILLPVSRKLADDYKIDLTNLLDMCETNQLITQQMGKDELSHCWRLLGGLLSLQPNLQNDDSWFQTPIAQGLVNHLVSTYVSNGDLQSASMFLLSMSQTPYLKTKIQTKLSPEHNHDPILYAYASLLHRWKQFYKRTQILNQIDHNCQSPTPFNQTTTASSTIICILCLKPVLGQHFLCSICGHGGHLTHMHEWFSSAEFKHKICPEKDCTCRCITRQHDLLSSNILQMQQQQTSAMTPRSFYSRQSSGNVRPL